MRCRIWSITWTTNVSHSDASRQALIVLTLNWDGSKYFVPTIKVSECLRRLAKAAIETYFFQQSARILVLMMYLMITSSCQISYTTSTGVEGKHSRLLARHLAP